MSSIFSCSCVEHFQLLVCCVFLFLMCQALSVAWECCFQLLVCGVFFLLLASALNFFVLGACFVHVSGSKAVRESFARSLHTTHALVTCVSYVRLACRSGVKFLACRLFSFSSTSWTLYLFCLPIYQEFCLFVVHL